MDYSVNNNLSLISYEQFYNHHWRPKLEAIDLFIKEKEVPFNIYEVRQLLEIELYELTELMKTHNIKEINDSNLFTLILNASSPICMLIQRQWQYKTCTHYCPETIAHIYKLNLHKVKAAFDDLDLSLITDCQLMEIFKRIHLSNHLL